MAKRVSHSLLDPFLMPLIQGLYRRLSIPANFPPEGIIAVGHTCAVLGAFGFAYATTHWWGGLLAAIGVAGNHVADCMDGTHARSTNQCRNGGELLDHFVDPLSFSYWLCGWAVSIGHLGMGLAGVICLYATSVLTNIKAKMIGEFTLATFGPTEFKSLLVLYGIVQSALILTLGDTLPVFQLAFYGYSLLLFAGILQLLVGLVKAVREVNAVGAAPDMTEWETTRAE